MNELQARQWVNAQFDVSRETAERLQTYIDLLLVEADQQNLIAASTKNEAWVRHIADSAQLLKHAPEPAGKWLDLGSGAGLPGIVVAILSSWQVELVESRRMRIEFLQHVINHLGLSNATVTGGRLETLPDASPASVISARAFAPLDRLLHHAARFSNDQTRWILPKGRNAQFELASIRRTWQGVFHVEQSVTQADSFIIVAEGVRRRGR